MDSSRSRRSFSQLSSDEFDSKWFDLKCRIRGRIRSLNSDLKKFYSQFCPNVGQICLKNDFFWPYSAFEYLKFEKSNKFVRADNSQPHQKYFIKKRFLFSSNLKFHLLLESQRKKYYWYMQVSLIIWGVLRPKNISRIPKPRITRDHCLGLFLPFLPLKGQNRRIYRRISP